MHIVKEVTMKRTHYSLYYLIGYLIPGGLALLLVPQLALKFMFSTIGWTGYRRRKDKVVLKAPRSKLQEIRSLSI